MTTSRTALATLLALLFTFLAAAPAYAHATLLSSDPADGARLAAAPAEVRLTFSEAIRVVPDAVRLLGPDESSETVTAHTTDDVLVADLPDLAPNARYTIAWRVVSADGHTVSGLLTFSIGDAPPGPPPAVEPISADPILGITRAAATGLWYAGLLVVAGLLAFLVFCVRPIRAVGPFGSRLIFAGVLAGALGALALVPLSTLIGWRSVTAAVLSCVGLGAALVLVRRDRPVAALVAAAVALASPALTGHSAATRPLWLMVIGDLVHLAAGAVWLGGVLGLVLYLRRADKAEAVPDAGEAAAVVGRFSGLAGTTLFTAALAGITMALLILPDRTALFDTAYGLALLIKLALVGVAAGLGGWNRFRLLPALGVAADPWRALTRILRIEVAALAAVVLATGFLANLSPAAGTGAVPAEDGPVTVASDTIPVRGATDDVVVIGTATPAGDDSTQLTYTVQFPSGATMHLIEAPSVTVSLPEENLGPTRYESRDSPTEPHGTYLVDLDTPVAGRWQVFVGVRLSPFDQATVPLDLTLG